MNENGPYRVIGNGVIEGVTLGVDVTLLNEVCYWEWGGFEVSEAQARLSGSLCLPAAYGSSLATSTAQQLLACRLASYHDNNRLNL